MLNIKQAIADKVSLPELIIKSVEADYPIAIGDSKKEFWMMSNLIQTKLELRRNTMELSQQVNTLNLSANAIINKLKTDIENAEDTDGKKIYSNDSKRKTELDTRLTTNQEYQTIQVDIDVLKEQQAEIDMAMSIARSYIGFLTKK